MSLDVQEHLSLHTLSKTLFKESSDKNDDKEDKEGEKYLMEGNKKMTMMTKILDGWATRRVPLFHFELDVAQDASDLVVQRFRDLIIMMLTRLKMIIIMMMILTMLMMTRTRHVF